MTRKPFATIRLLVLLGLALLASAPLAGAASPVHRLTTNQVPGAQLRSFDIGWWDPANERYYLAANRFTTGPVLGVINARTNVWLQNVSVGPPGTNSHSVAAEAENNTSSCP